MKDLKKSEMKVLELEEVKEITGLGSNTVDLLVLEGSFPQPIVVCGQELGWSAKEVDEWMWIKAIEASWRGDRGWRGGVYSAVRHPSNVLDLDAEAFFLIQADLKIRFQAEEGARVPMSVKPADPFGDALEMDDARI